MKFDSMGLAPELLRAVAAQGYTRPTPIQAQSIPAILDGRDVIGGAQTGTGKTAAFALPILQLLDNGEPAGKHPRALIVTPTRELAEQVGESFRTYGANFKLKIVKLYGGVKINPQIAGLRQGCDIVVATPGRLLDHLNQKTLNLRYISMLVLDEADRMLDMGFIHDIRKIIKAVPKERQTLLFSATYSKEIRQLAETVLNNPLEVEVARRNTAAELVDQRLFQIEKSQKRHLLAHLIKKHNWFQVLVFVRTKHGANRLARQLQQGGIPAAAIHGDKSQGTRTRVLSQFKKGDLQALIATDIAARGLHLEHLSHVVNFDLPNVPEDYIHRIGRTGRAGKSGEAISLVAPDEKKLLLQIQKILKKSIPEDFDDDFKPVKTQPYQPHPSNRSARDNSLSNKKRKDNRLDKFGNSHFGNKKHNNKLRKSS